MKQQELIHLLRHPGSIAAADTEKLALLTHEFPFFQAAQMLYALGLKDQAPQHYQKQLRKTAIVANNRAVLYELLHAAPIVTPAVSTPEPKVEEPSPSIAVSPVSTTANDVRVIYVTTTPPARESAAEEPVNPATSNTEQEINILKDIENKTEAPPAFDEEKLNREIEMEVSRQIIDSYVQKEVLRTPEWHEPVKPAQDPAETMQQEQVSPEPVAAEPGSFLDWLRKVQDPKTEKTGEKPEKTLQKELKTTQNTPENSKFEEKKKIIDRIIESDPGKIRLNKDKFFNASQDAKQSLLENEHLITETLAKIYALQGNTAKAIRAYEILSLKFPQKSVYFASLIEKLKTK